MAIDTVNSTSMHLDLPEGLLALLGGAKIITLAGNATLDDTYPSLLALDCGGSGRTITLDGSSAADRAVRNVVRVIANVSDGAENLTIQDAGTPTTIAVLNQDEGAVFFHDSDETVGWQRVFGFTVVVDQSA